MAVTLHAHTMSAVLSGNRGAVGVGIADIAFNDDYTMTITLTDGSTYTSGNLRGAQGIPGIDAEYDGEELVITEGNDAISDGGEVSTIRVKGEARVIRDRVTEEMACSAYPTETVTGDIVSISDGAENIPVKALTVAVEPKQAGSGDPSPDNIRAITGWDAVNVVRCGVNLFDKNEVEYSKWLSTTTGLTENATNYCVSGYIAVKKDHPVYIPASGSGRRWFYDINKSPVTYLNNATNQIFTPPQDGYIRVTLAYNSYSVDTYQIELGSYATAYKQYSGTTYPIPLPSTVYGGTLDVSTGMMTVTHAEIILDGTEGWGYQDGMFYTGGKHASVSYPDGYCDTYKVVKSYAAMQSGDFVISSTATVIRVKDSGYTDAASFQANITQHPVKFIWRLSTPQTITLDPVTISTLLGNNTIYADAGQVTVAYRADVGLYIDKRIAEVQALVLES